MNEVAFGESKSLQAANVLEKEYWLSKTKLKVSGRGKLLYV